MVKREQENGKKESKRMVKREQENGRKRSREW